MGAEGGEFYFTTVTAAGETHHIPMGSRKKAQNYLKKVVKLSHAAHVPVTVSEMIRPDYTLLGKRAQTNEEKREQRKKV